MKLILEGIKFSSIFIAIIAIFPPLSVFYPGYKHKKLYELGYRDNLIVNVVAVAFIAIFILVGILDWSILLIYLVFLFQEVMFEYFNGLKYYLKLFDKINIMGIVTTILFFIISNYVMSRSSLDMEKLKSIYRTTTEISEVELNYIFNYITNNKYIIWFLYSYLSSLIFYYIFFKKVLEAWYMSYIWVVFYIIVFLMGYYYDKNILINNLIVILKIILGVYGLKFSYVAMKKWEINKIISTIILLSVMLIAPQLFFVIGAIRVLII